MYVYLKLRYSSSPETYEMRVLLGNVVFGDDISAASAMKALSQPLKVTKKPVINQTDVPGKKNSLRLSWHSEFRPSEYTALNIFVPSLPLRYSLYITVSRKNCSQVASRTPKPALITVSFHQKFLLKTIRYIILRVLTGNIREIVTDPSTDEEILMSDVFSFPIPVPQGTWRAAKTVPSHCKQLVMRFARNIDKKPPNAQKYSQYYAKYGNPRSYNDNSAKRYYGTSNADQNN